jgi:hypothetical protein
MALNRVPNLFVIGVPKAGTTSLFRWLGDHPAICKSSENELRFLMDGDDPLCRDDGYLATGLDGYGRFYPETADDPAIRYRIDVSPQYYYQRTAQNVIGSLADSQVIMILRKPSARIYSLYNYSRSNKVALDPGMSFSDFVAEIRRGPASPVLGSRPMLHQAIEHSKYARYVERWRKIVGHGRMTVCLFEELVRRPETEMRKIARRLDLGEAFYAAYDFPRHNESVEVRNRELHKLVRRSREKIPGWMRTMLKSTYLRLNTRKLDRRLSAADRQTLRELDRELSSWNRELTALLGRKEPVWKSEPTEA